MKAVSSPKRAPMSVEMVQRIMRRVPYQEGFRFSRGIGDYTGQVATSLEDFAEMLRTVDSKSIDFHMERRDFEKWVVGIFGDEELAQIINRRMVFQGEKRRDELIMAMKNHLEDLRKMPKTA
jgi:hypothetical protein